MINLTTIDRVANPASDYISDAGVLCDSPLALRDYIIGSSAYHRVSKAFMQVASLKKLASSRQNGGSGYLNASDIINIAGIYKSVQNAPGLQVFAETANPLVGKNMSGLDRVDVTVEFCGAVCLVALLNQLSTLDSADKIMEDLLNYLDVIVTHPDDINTRKEHFAKLIISKLLDFLPLGDDAAELAKMAVNGF